MKVAGLFDSQSSASAAVETLNKQFDKVEISTIEQFEPRQIPQSAAGTAYEISLRGLAGHTASVSPVQDIRDTAVGLRLNSEEARFFAEGVRRGGVLVVVDAPDAQVRAVEDALKEEGGRTAVQ